MTNCDFILWLEQRRLAPCTDGEMLGQAKSSVTRQHSLRLAYVMPTQIHRSASFYGPLSQRSAPFMLHYYQGQHLSFSFIIRVSTFRAPLSSGSAPSMLRYHLGQHLP